MNYIEVNGKILLYAKCKDISCNICQHYNQSTCKGSIINNWVLSKPITKVYISEIIRNAITDILKNIGRGS